MFDQRHARLGWLVGLSALSLLQFGCPAPLPPSGQTPVPELNPLDVIVQSLTDQPPVADAGQNQVVGPGQTVQLTGTASHDPDANNLTFAWVQTEGPAVAIQQSSASLARFVAPQVTSATVLTFRLTVTDGFRFDTADVQITVQP